MAEKKKRTWTDAQECAMNLRDKLLLVSAAAGSGKTSVLTERIIRTLTQPENPADLSRMLIVTFTRAATAELKSRIAAALTEALSERPGDPHLSRQLFLLGSAQISTIDSFFQQAVRANFEQLELPASFRLADEAEAGVLSLSIMGEAVRALYDRYTAAPEESVAGSPLNRLRGNRFANAMDHLISNRSDSKFDSKLLSLRRRFRAFPEDLELLSRYAADYRAAADVDPLLSDAGSTLCKFLADTFTEILSDLEKTLPYLEIDADSLAKYGDIHAYDLDFCRNLLAGLDNRSFEAVRAEVLHYAPKSFPRYSNKPAAILEYKAVRDRLRDLKKTVAASFFACSAQEIGAQMSSAADVCELLRELFAEFDSRIWEEKRARGILEFDDVRALLYRLLVDGNGEETPFAKSLSEQYDTVYIDEYQDVDSLQDRIFAIIGKDRRFMVGDIKQSIYGFRGSEPSIFTGYRNAMPQHDDPAAAVSDAVCVFMSENFRCNEPVIRFANHVCSFLFSACEENVGYRPKDDLVFSKGRDKSLDAAPAVQTVVFEGYPRRNGSEEEDDEDDDKPLREAQWVAGEISRLIRTERLDNGKEIRPSDVAILVRNKKHGKRFASELEALGIPVSAPGSEDILHEPLMTDTLNLLRVIDNPHKDLPLSEYLLCPDGGWTLEELSEIRGAAPDRKSLHDALSLVAEDESHPLSAKCCEWLEWLESQRKLSVSLPVDRFLRLLYLEPRLSDYASTPELLTLYEQARSYQRTSWCGLFGFLNYVDRLLEEETVSAAGFRTEDDAVKIMTIHHSKGLEFPVVFLCSCDKRPSDQSVKDNLIFHRRIGCTSKLFCPEDGVNHSSWLREIAKNEVRIDEAEEAIRVLYVALTRARERLYVTGTPQGKVETALENASAVKRGSREAILLHGNYLRWILAALLENGAGIGEFPCIFRHFSLSDPIEGIPLDAGNETEEAAVGSACTSSAYRKILDASLEFRYPLEELRGLPTKAAASKLSFDLLDTVYLEEDSHTLQQQIELMTATPPSFDALLDRRRKPGAAEIGTATHEFLQYCSPEALARNGVQSEIDRLVTERFLTEDTAAILDSSYLERFRESELLSRILSAKKVYREQKFSLFIPYSCLTEKQKDSSLLRNHSILVQGSIDLILETEDGRLILFDYKTDHVTAEEQCNPRFLEESMKQKHGEQISCYAAAVKRLFGKAPDETYIYSVPLGRAIAIPAEPFRFE